MNSALKPFLLEVNHAPSFATDSVLDYNLKKQLLIDTFTILGLTKENKKKKLLAQQECILQRVVLKQIVQDDNQLLGGFIRLTDEEEAAQ